MARNLLVIADDQKLNRQMLGDLLSADYDIEYAADGIETLELVKKYVNDISVVLLDITMPRMDGLEVLDHMKKNPEYSKIPVIILTAIEKYETEIKALSLGAIDFITKPYRQEIVCQKVRNIVMLKNALDMNDILKFDSITGAYTREYFFESARELLDANKGARFDMLSLDIDRFKLLSDTYGTEVGDRFLRHLADGLKRLCPEDMATFGHMATDQFAILFMREKGNMKDFVKKLDAIIKSFEVETDIRIKIGIYEMSETDKSDLSTCHDRAHLAGAYISPDSQKNYKLYDTKMRDKAIRDQFMTNVMHEALDNGEFVVYLQPKVNLENGKIAGAEALVRWINPKEGFMPPGDFVPLFESNGFIYDLDKYVWEKSCKYLSNRISEGKKNVPISVNVSRRDFLRRDLTAFFVELVKKYNLDFSLLHLEITESSYMEDPTSIIRIADGLKEAGFTLEMDDFGSGYSSLNMLSTFPIDMLKIDKAFLDNEDITDESNIVKFVIDLAKCLELKTICEGVETEDQVEALKKMGCDFMQGYYFSKPVPADDFFEMLDRGM